MKLLSFIKYYITIIDKKIREILNFPNEINNLKNEINSLKFKINNQISTNLYPDIDDSINYKWQIFKFADVIPKDKTTNQIQINIKHDGFYTNFKEINSANHKILLKVVDPTKKSNWETPWMDACNATSMDAMFSVDGTRCIYGIFSNTEERICFIGSNTSNRAIFYVMVGIPRELNNISLNDINIIPINKFKEKSYIE